MSHLPPLYTEKTECQDCYKCLRQCSVKAIKIQDGHAKIMPELCVACGHCVDICPVGAKRVRDDVDRARLLLTLKKKVVLSLAPSWITEFPDTDKATMVDLCKRLGFWGVSETALGAQEVSANVAEMLGHTDCGVFVSSACPTVVAIIKKYYPDHADKVTDMLSPLLAHAKMLRATYGEDIGIVFAGPCIAKKTESDTHPNLLDLAITFQGLRRWMDSEHGVPRTEASGRDTFIPHEANEGVLYPVDGGMIAGIKANCVVHDTAYMTFSGIDNIGRVLADVDTLKPKTPIFIELLACEGGCVNGPGAASRAGTVAKRFTVINSCQYATAQTPRVPMLDITEDLGIAPVCHTAYTEGEIVGALQSVGKYTKEDELNCGGCGYDACRGFARALLDGIAEMDMCVGYMRLLAHKKANALIRTMPSGVVIVDKTLCIVECNRHFAEMLGQDTSMVFDVKPGLEGAHLKKIAPFYRHFERALKEGVSAFETECRIDEMVINLHVFTIEPHHLVGGIIQDITVPVIHKERIVKKAQDVITRNVETVQKIAYLLGENAADSEVILNSIITSFSSEEATQGADNG